MTDRLYNVVGKVLGVPVEHITDEDSPNTIESWNSLAHVNLVLALEAEFEVSISPDDATEMVSVGLIRKILCKQGAASLDGRKVSA